ncbi:MAG TPA: hypothetical protein VD707_08000 [Gemmatimonadales bacterium]|jgi:hypothetical protein|nr:hypothetical protein [Gemmatimonadales bacterium]
MIDLTRSQVGAVIAAVVALGCADRGPEQGDVVLKLFTGAPAVGAGTLVVGRGTDTIVIRTADLVLREVQLQLVRVGECEEEEGERCAMVADGPTRFALPLGSDTLTLAPVAAAADTYGTLQLEVYRATTERDTAFLASHPDMAGVSVRVSGAYSRAGSLRDFVFTTDLNEVQELGLDAPFVVAKGTSAGLLIGVDVAKWFLSADSAGLIDPATAGPDGPNAAQVRDNIRTSFVVRVLSSP